MAEHCLLRIIDAADPADGDDIAIRHLLVSALSDSDIPLARMLDRQRQPLAKSCAQRAARRAPSPWRRARPRNRRRTVVQRRHR